MTRDVRCRRAAHLGIMVARAPRLLSGSALDHPIPKEEAKP